jgi:hypothetical protein
MKLTTIALATAFAALFSTLALAAGAGGGGAGAAGTVSGGGVGLNDQSTGNAGPKMPSKSAEKKHRKPPHAAAGRAE